MYKDKVPSTGAAKGFVIAVIIMIVLCIAVVLPFLYTIRLGL